MKPVILHGCPKCRGTLAQEELIKDEDSGKVEVEFACTSCGYRVYRTLKANEQVKTKHYGN